MSGVAAQSLFGWSNKLLGDDLKLQHIPIKWHNTSATNSTKNSVLDSRTKHIEIPYYLFCDHVENSEVVFEHVDTQSHLADIFTKPLVSE